MDENIIHMNISGYDVIFDTLSYNKIKNLKWHKHHAKSDGNKIYFIHKSKKTNNKNVRMHRYILGLENNNGKYVDHINGNTLDNRMCNLRVCTVQQNSWNRNKCYTKKTSSIYKGVAYIKQSRHSIKGKPWMATIYYDNKNHYLGLYRTEKEAHEAYLKKAIEMFGEYACLN